MEKCHENDFLKISILKWRNGFHFQASVTILTAATRPTTTTKRKKVRTKETLHCWDLLPFTFLYFSMCSHRMSVYNWNFITLLSFHIWRVGILWLDQMCKWASAHKHTPKLHEGRNDSNEKNDEKIRKKKRNGVRIIRNAIIENMHAIYV